MPLNLPRVPSARSYQDLVKINLAVETGSIAKEPNMVAAFDAAFQSAALPSVCKASS